MNPVPGLVSVIIPTYNRAKTVCTAVQSVLEQDYPQVEVLVVDDGSKDETAEVVQGRYAEDPRVRYLFKANGGVCTARNHGLEQARGEFVGMLDSDDAWLPGKLRKQVALLQAHPELSLVWSDMAAVTPDGEIQAPRYLRKMYGAYRFFPEPLDLFTKRLVTPDGSPYFIGQLAGPMILGNLIHTSTVLGRLTRFREAGFYDQSCNPSEDQEYYFRVCRTGPVAYLDEVTLHYTVGSADAATAPSQNLKLALSYLKVIHRLLESEPAGVLVPKRLVRTALHDGYSWAGSAYFDQGRYREARRYLWKALCLYPLDLQALKYLVGSCLPASILAGLRNFSRMRA